MAKSRVSLNGEADAKAWVENAAYDDWYKMPAGHDAVNALVRHAGRGRWISRLNATYPSQAFAEQAEEYMDGWDSIRNHLP